MNLMQLKKDLSTNHLSNLYIFTGEEIAIMDIYIDKIKKAFGGDCSVVSSLESVATRVKSNSLFGSDKTLFIIRGDSTLTSSKNEKLWNSLKSGSYQGKHILLFVYNTIDKREKFYKEFTDYIVTFDALSTDILVKYVLKEIDVSKDKASFLVELCQNSYNKILLETDKLKCLANHRGISDNEAFDICLKSNYFHRPVEGEVFDLLNSILHRDISKVYEDFLMFNRRGDSPIVILSLLHNNLKAILQLQCAQGLSNLGQVTGLSGFQIQNAQKFIGVYSNAELIRMIKIVRFCEKSIKQTGIVDMENALDFIFIKIF